MGVIPHLAAALLLLVGGCDQQRFTQRSRGEPLAAGQPAPAYTVATLDGDSLALSDLRGKVVLLNVWATWCRPCLEEFPVLERLHRRFQGEGFRLVGISVDHQSPAELERFLEQQGVSYTNGRERQHRLQQVFGWGRGVPQSLLIDRQGRVAHYWAGGLSPARVAAHQALTDTIVALLR